MNVGKHAHAVRDLSRMLRPRSVAVLGGGWAHNVVQQCQRMGFGGPIWPVHPSRSHIAGVPCYASLAALPGAPDSVFLGVNRHASLPLVRELAAMGAGGVVCFASGWAEAGEASLQQELVQAAGSMPVLGPNCYGLINYLDGALLWPDQHGGVRCERGVALLSQSSNIAINLSMQARGLPLAYVACLGNAAQVGLAELAAALLSDARVTALGLYVEGFGDAPAFARLAHEARAAGKGIVCLKSGKTSSSQQAAASHTASLAGEGKVSSAYLRQLGVAEVGSLAALLETLKIFHMHGPSVGPRVCSLSCSGGEASLVADTAGPLGLQLPPPGPAQAEHLAQVLGPIVHIANPLDYHTFIWGDQARTTEVFSTMLSGYDAGVFVIDPPRPDRCDPSSFEPALRAIASAAQSTGKLALAVASLPENLTEALASDLMAQGVVPMMGLDSALQALVAAQTPAGQAHWQPWEVSVSGSNATVSLLDEAAAKRWLAGAGVSVPRGVRGADADGLLQAARELAQPLVPPLALKGLGLLHKTEMGAVRLGLTSLDEVAHSLASQPMQGVSGLWLEEMANPPVAEVLLGLRRDPVYGATLTMGLGGVFTELLADTVTLVLPAGASDIERALHSLRGWPLLAGYRGKPGADVEALIHVVLALQEAMAKDTSVQEIEINPLLLGTCWGVAVDAVLWKST